MQYNKKIQESKKNETKIKNENEKNEKINEIDQRIISQNNEK